MSDLVARLRASVTQCRALDRSELLAEAAAEIERLRDALTREPGTAALDNCVPGNQPEMGCPVTKPLPKEKRAEVSDSWRDHIRPPDDFDRAIAAATDEAWGISETPTTAPAADGTDWPTSGAAVAWAVVSDSREEIDCEFIYPDEATAGDVALDINGGVVPLYRQPQPTLTDAERGAIKEASEFYVGTRTGVALGGLLERLK